MVRARVGLDLPRAGLHDGVRRGSPVNTRKRSVRTDKEIAGDVTEELRWSPDVKHSNIRADLPVIAEHVQIVVRDGHVTLDVNP
jgi:hypothetical protein